MTNLKNLGLLRMLAREVRSGSKIVRQTASDNLKSNVKAMRIVRHGATIFGKGVRRGAKKEAFKQSLEKAVDLSLGWKGLPFQGAWVAGEAATDTAKDLWRIAKLRRRIGLKIRATRPIYRPGYSFLHGIMRVHPRPAFYSNVRTSSNWTPKRIAAPLNKALYDSGTRTGIDPYVRYANAMRKEAVRLKGYR